jgi:hypothetical protein
MLTLTQAAAFGACATPDANGLFKKLTGLKIVGAQIISDQDARGISDELVSTVRCNAEDAAKKVIIPAVIAAGVAAFAAGAVLLFSMRRHRAVLGDTKRRPYKRPKKEREPAWFVDPETGDVIDLDQSTVEYKKLRGRRR